MGDQLQFSFQLMCTHTNIHTCICLGSTRAGVKQMSTCTHSLVLTCTRAKRQKSTATHKQGMSDILGDADTHRVSQ